MALVLQCLANLPFAWIALACYVTAGLHVPQCDRALLEPSAFWVEQSVQPSLPQSSTRSPPSPHPDALAQRWPTQLPTFSMRGPRNRHWSRYDQYSNQTRQRTSSLQPRALFSGGTMTPSESRGLLPYLLVLLLAYWRLSCATPPCTSQSIRRSRWRRSAWVGGLRTLMWAKGIWRGVVFERKSGWRRLGV